MKFEDSQCQRWRWLGPAAFDMAWMHGCALSLAEAIEEALGRRV